MGVSSTTVGLVCTALVLFFSIAGYYLFFYEEKEKPITTSTPTHITTDSKSKEVHKKKPSKLKPSTTKGFNAKAALSHATDHKDHPLYWRELGGHQIAATCVAFSHPQQDLVASGSADGTVRCVVISELGTPSPCEVYTKLDCAPDAMSLTQNAKRLIVAAKGNIYFYSISVTQKLRKIELVKSFPCSLKNVHTLQLLDVEQWMVIVVAGYSSQDGTPSIQAFNPKGQLINEYNQVKRQGRADKHRLPNPLKALAVSSPDDRFIALYGGGSLTAPWVTERWGYSRWSEILPDTRRG